jgi:BatD DUF11 like domain
MVKRTTALVLLLLFAAPFSLLAAQVSAVADRDRLAAGESLQLELRVQGSADGEADLGPLEQDWEILSRSQSSQMQIINGSFNRSLVLSLTLMPKHSGSLVVPAVCFGGDCSLPLPIQVSQEAATSQSGAAGLLLETEATPPKALVGSQVLLTVRLLHRVELAQASLSEPTPQGVEAEIQRLGEDRHFETRRDGYLYQAIERRYVLFPHQAGTLQLPALQLDAQVAAASSRMDPFGRSLKPLRRHSAPLAIEVVPPPADPQGRSWLPARELTLEDDWQAQPPALRVGVPATRTLVLKAHGLPAAQLPELKLPVPDGWKSYPDQPSREDAGASDGVVGTLQQKIALVPTHPGEVELPAVALDWYDVSAQQWRRARLDPLRVTVAPAAAGTLTSAPQSTAQPAPPTAAENKPPAVAPSPQPSPAVVSAPAAGFWPWLSLLLGLGWLLSLLLFWRLRRRSRKPARNQPNPPKIDREKDALRAIRSAAGNNDPKAAREALLAWSRCRWPGGQQDLERLAQRCGEPLAGELALLGAALYAPAVHVWQGTGLLEALQGWLQQQKNRPHAEALPPLYPGSEAD